MKKLVLLCLLNITIISASEEKITGKCIILDGASSAGKSTLARHLVEILPDTWEITHHSSHVSQVIEKAKNIGLLQDNCTYKSLPHLFTTIRTAIMSCEGEEKIQKQRAWQQINVEWKKSFYESISHKLENGNNVILDTSLYKKQEFILAQEALQPYNPFFVCVHIPFEALVARVNTRNASYNCEQHRFLNQVLYQYACCYCTQKTKDTHTVGMLCADTIQKVVDTYAPCQSETMSPFIPTGDQLTKKIMSMMDISKEHNSFLKPRLAHDVIINTHYYSPQEASNFVRDVYLCHLAYDDDTTKRNGTLFAQNTPDMLYEDQK